MFADHMNTLQPKTSIAGIEDDLLVLADLVVASFLTCVHQSVATSKPKPTWGLEFGVSIVLDGSC